MDLKWKRRKKCRWYYTLTFLLLITWNLEMNLDLPYQHNRTYEIELFRQLTIKKMCKLPLVLISDTIISLKLKSFWLNTTSILVHHRRSPLCWTCLQFDQNSERDKNRFLTYLNLTVTKRREHCSNWSMFLGKHQLQMISCQSQKDTIIIKRRSTLSDIHALIFKEAG